MAFRLIESIRFCRKGRGEDRFSCKLIGAARRDSLPQTTQFGDSPCGRKSARTVGNEGLPSSPSTPSTAKKFLRSRDRFGQSSAHASRGQLAEFRSRLELGSMRRKPGGSADWSIPYGNATPKLDQEKRARTEVPAKSSDRSVSARSPMITAMMLPPVYDSVKHAIM
jgi:hypothetical protein